MGKSSAWRVGVIRAAQFAAATMVIVLWPASAWGQIEAEFKSTIERKNQWLPEVNARSAPAKIATEDEKIWERPKYFLIGTISASAAAKAADPGISDQLKSAILQKAAAAGGDVVLLSKNEEPGTVQVTEAGKGKCIEWESGIAIGVYQDSMDHNKLKSGPHNITVCKVKLDKYKTVPGIISEGTVWRYDPHSSWNLPPLGWAAYYGQEGAAEWLLAKGADVNAKGDGKTPLCWAALMGHWDVSELLISKGADRNAADDEGWTPLRRAVHSHHKDVADLLRQLGAHYLAGVNDPSVEKFAEALETGDLQTVMDTLNHNPSPATIRGVWGFWPLHEAVREGYGDVAALLIAKGAVVNAKDSEGRTPLHLAAQVGSKDVVGLLLAKGADVNATYFHGTTPLHLATENGCRGVAELLIAKGAVVNTKDSEGRTPLHLAAENGCKDEAELLIAKGADINAADNDGKTPLHYAASHREFDVQQLLLTKGANRNAVDKAGSSPLLVYRLSAGEILAIIGKKLEGTEVQAFLSKLGESPHVYRDDYLFYACGITEIDFDEAHVITRVWVDKQFKGELPFGISVRMTRKEIESILGPPDVPDISSSDYKSKGITVHYPIRRDPNDPTAPIEAVGIMRPNT